MDRGGYINRNHYNRRDSSPRDRKSNARTRRDSRDDFEDRYRRSQRSPSPRGRNDSRRRGRTPESRGRGDSRDRDRKSDFSRRSPTPDKKARNINLDHIRPESPTRLIVALKALKKSLIRSHGDAVVDRDDRLAKMCEWGVDRLDWGLSDVRKHHERHVGALKAGNETNAELERHLMNEAKRKAIAEVHAKFEGKDIDLNDPLPSKNRKMSTSTVGSHCEECKTCIDCKDPAHQQALPPGQQQQQQPYYYPPPPHHYYPPPPQPAPQQQQYIYVDPRTGQPYQAGHNPNPYGQQQPKQQQPQQTQQQVPADPAPTTLPGQPEDAVESPKPIQDSATPNPEEQKDAADLSNLDGLEAKQENVTDDIDDQQNALEQELADINGEPYEKPPKSKKDSSCTIS